MQKFSLRQTILLACAVVFCLVSFACERPLVEVQSPGVSVVRPDLSRVQTSQQIEVFVNAESFREIEQVVLNSQPMTKDEGDLWKVVVDLNRIITQLDIVAVDIGGVETRLVEWAARVGLATAVGPNLLSDPRGGHTATRFSSGQVLVTGGARTDDGDAIGTMELSNSAGSDFQLLSNELLNPRTGHSASVLPSGRVIFLGGAARYNPGDVSEMVSEVEIFDFETNGTVAIPVVGEPIRRAFHTASVRVTQQGTLIDIVGGVGDIQYIPQPRFGIRSDLRTFQLRDDTLFALSPAIGPLLPEPLFGHTQSKLEPARGRFQPQRYIYAGSNSTQSGNTGFVLDFGSPVGIDVDSAATFQQQRSHHAAVSLGGGVVVFFGGRDESSDQVLNSSEIYSDPADRFFSIPEGGTPLLRRFGHSATLLNDSRILLLGGFTAAGNGISHAEFVGLSN